MEDSIHAKIEDNKKYVLKLYGYLEKTKNRFKWYWFEK